MNSGTSRNAVLVVICILCTLLAFMGFAAAFSRDLSETNADILVKVIGAIVGVLAVLGVVFRLESVKETVESVDRKADSAAVAAGKAERTAAVAAQKTAVVEQVVKDVRHDIHNDVLIQKVLAAIRQAEADPEIQEHRIEIAAKGVQADRHSVGSREANAYARGFIDAEKRYRPQGAESEPGPEQP